MTPSEKQAKIEAAMAAIDKEYGKNTVVRMDTAPARLVDVIPSGSIVLNDALGIGGWPRGRIVEIYGPESSGKSTLCLEAIAEVHAAGGNAAFIDAEHAMDLNYAKALGVKEDKLYLCQPDNGEQALEIADSLISSGGFDLVVVDSVAALVPKSEIEGQMGDAQMALQARLMSQAMRKLTGTVSNTNTCLIFTNQLRMKIGVVFGNPETTTGGNALKFAASVRVDIRRGDIAKGAEENTITSIKAKVKIVKNKMAPPFKQCELTFGWGTGITIYNELVELAVKYDIIEKAGSWFSYNDERLGQGTENLITLLKDNQPMFEEIERKVYEKMNLPYKQREVIAAVVQDEKPVRKTRVPKEEKELEV